MMEQFIASPSLAELDTFSIKVLRALAKELDIKLTSSAMKKKQIRHENDVHLVNSDLLDENALDTVEIGKEERSGAVNSEFAVQLQIKQMEIALERERIQMEIESKEKLEQERVQKEIESKEKLEQERVQKEIESKEKLERERMKL